MFVIRPTSFFFAANDFKVQSFIRPHRCVSKMRPILTDCVAWFVCLCDTVVIPAKAAELIEMPFGVRIRVGPRNHVLNGGLYPHRKG